MVPFEGDHAVIDEVSLPYVAGTTLDYVEGLTSGIQIQQSARQRAPAAADPLSAPERKLDGASARRTPGGASPAYQFRVAVICDNTAALLFPC